MSMALARRALLLTMYPELSQIHPVVESILSFSVTAAPKFKAHGAFARSLGRL